MSSQVIGSASISLEMFVEILMVIALVIVAKLGLIAKVFTIKVFVLKLHLISLVLKAKKYCNFVINA